MTTNTQLAHELEIVIPLLPEKDRGFAKSLSDYFKKNHKWSEKQLYWAGKMIQRAVTPVTVKEQPVADLGKFQKVYELFTHAKQHGAKYPKLKLQTKSGEPVQLSVAGSQSKVPGVINVTDGQPFGSNKWYGRIDEDGHWSMNNKFSEEELAKVGGLLRALSKDPEAVVSEYGLMTGNCSCCGKQLTDPKSIAIGIGPVCKKKWLG